MALLGARAEAQSFVDPTADVTGNVVLGDLVYVAPFALLNSGTHTIDIGNESDVQDSVLVDASVGEIELGERVILAHGASVLGPAGIGEDGTCPNGVEVCPSFVGFNAVVDGATVEKDAMVLTLARVGPGVTIPSGRKVLSGFDVTSGTEADAETAEVTEANRLFMESVIEINVAFAESYPGLEAADPDNVRGINFDPDTEFNPGEQLPNLECVEDDPGADTREPGFRNRIIGEICLADSLEELDLRMGSQISLRADEGAPFIVGHIDTMANRTTFHALENEQVDGEFLAPDDPAAEPRIETEDGTAFGYRSLVHGGPADFDPTFLGEGAVLGDWSVLFRSEFGFESETDDDTERDDEAEAEDDTETGDESRIGYKSLVQASSFPAGTVIDSCEIWVENAKVRDVEWCNIDPVAPTGGEGD